MSTFKSIVPLHKPDDCAGVWIDFDEVFAIALMKDKDGGDSYFSLTYKGGRGQKIKNTKSIRDALGLNL